jgi:hypothetical protein
MTRQALPEVINLQPHPRLLSVLGDIEFAPWQCLAELIDNAFDEFLRHADEVLDPTVTVSLPSKGSDPRHGEVWVKDNGPGLSLDQLQNALRAGWTSNDRYGRLGLFGMGFNIATARLGHIAIVRTARRDATAWTVVTIDLRQMAAQGHFDVPVRSEPKDHPDEHGTEIVIRDLRPQHHDTLSRQQAKIRQTLGDVYSYLLAERGFTLIVDRQAVKPRRPCVWDESRHVVRNRERIPAVIRIDVPLADRYACLDCGHWQDDSGPCEDCDGTRLEIRPRRIWGWLGIQRYIHPTDYGIDFLRNGRKILLRDVRMFSWVDPDDPAGRGEQEYPLEVPSGQGRIVGEIHVDHVPVTYQKNAFEYDSPDWRRVVRTLRGEGPLLPKRARALGIPENTSHLAKLVAGYRRNDPGLNYLTPGDGKHAMHEKAKEWAERFRRGDALFQTDEQWYLQAELHDNPPTPVDAPLAEEDVNGILAAKGLLGLPPSVPSRSDKPPGVALTEDERRDSWRAAGRRLPDLEGKFGLPGHGAALQVTAWLCHGHRQAIGPADDAQPVYVGGGRGSSVEVFIDAEHPVFTDFAVDTRDLVVVELADFLRQRDRSSRAVGALFYELKAKCLPDHKVAGPFLKQTADRIVSRIREAMHPIIVGSSSGYWSLLSPEDQAATQRKYAEEGGRVEWDELLSSGEWLDYAPAMSIVRIVSSRPDAFLDGRVLRSSYASLSEPMARKASAERVIDLLSDVANLADRQIRRGPEELQRGRLSCSLLEEELAFLEAGPA